MKEWTLEKLRDPDGVIPRLVQAGLSISAANKKAESIGSAADRILQKGVPRTAPATACIVPGRIEVLGKHTDYVGGRSLIAAAEQGFCAVAVARRDATVHITDIQNGENCAFELSADLVPTAGHWSNYPMTVARRIARNFPSGFGQKHGQLRGADIAWISDLPPAAGMSSSSALIVLTFLLVSRINNLASRENYTQNIGRLEDLAGYLGTIENGQSFGSLAGDLGVGTFGGSEDHTAILCSTTDHLGQFSYCPVLRERSIQLSGDHVFALASSGVVAEKTGAAMGKYNRASGLASAAAEIWRQTTGRHDRHLAAAVASAPDAADRIRDMLAHSSHAIYPSEELVRRFEHFMIESEELIPAVADRLEGAALIDFGEIVDRSQSIAIHLLGNQVPETMHLAATARELGALAASAFGAGFGGSVWALVAREEAETFLNQWRRRYLAVYPERADQALFFTSSPAPAAFRIDDRP
ncbi:MAG: hypothetical protein JW829_13295 [Pirellulales bacterium]|nr:hypothetical protein [Pirellulales bacterium]